MSDIKNEVRLIDSISHIEKRYSMYLGSLNFIKTEELIFNKETGKLEREYISYIPGLLKLIDEILANSIDEAIRTQFKKANNINIEINSTSVMIEDNGRGIPVKKDETNTEYQPVLAWTYANASGNYDDDENRTTIGTNGLGGAIVATFSKKFIGISDDGKQRIEVLSTEKNKKNSYKLLPTTKKTGCKVMFDIEFEKFEEKFISKTHMDIIYQRLLNLSIIFPKINFTFNKEQIKCKTEEEYLKLFGNDVVYIKDENYIIGVTENTDDDFFNFSYVNGIYTKKGGNHINYVCDKLVSSIKDKLSKNKELANIKPNDIKNKIKLIIIANNMKNLTFESQTKESISNSISQMSEYFANADFNLLTKKILSNENIKNNIIEVYTLKQELSQAKELVKKDKKAKVKNFIKYTSAIKTQKYLTLVEGASAMAGLSPVLGRNEFGYYELRGVPMNAFDKTTLDVVNNTELNEIRQIMGIKVSDFLLEDGNWYEISVESINYIVNEFDMLKTKEGQIIDVASYKNKTLLNDDIEEIKKLYKANKKHVVRKRKPIEYNYDYILIASDQDVDGFHIRGILLGFFYKYSTLLQENKILMLQTPLAVGYKGKKITKLFMSFDELKNNTDTSLRIDYKKGYGSWEKEELEEVISKYGIEKFIVSVTLDSEKMIFDWLGKDTSKRKEYIMNNMFNEATI